MAVQLPQQTWRGWKGWNGWLPPLALTAYGAALWVLRPRTPFEQDEVLFLKALAGYDVAKHSPHPPGYPLYVGIGKVVRWIVGDPIAALQLLAVVAALVAVAGTWALARRLGAGRTAALASAATLAATPAFLFHANVGLSDLPGAAFAVLAAGALLAALDSPDPLPFAAALCAAAIAIRPQLVLSLAALGIAAIVVAAHRRDWRALALSAATGLAVSGACWLPAVLVTGPERFRQAMADAGKWAAQHEAHIRLPELPLTTAVRHWLIAPLGPHVLGVMFWCAVAAGTVAWWRRGRRRLVAVALSCGGTYLVTAPFVMGATEAVRYVLPAFPFLALLAAGVLTLVPSSQQKAASLLFATWCVAAAVWIWPLLVLRARTPAPAWACLNWIVDHEDSRTTTVVYDGIFRPHVGYLLSPRGFHVEELREGVSYASEEPGGNVVFVTVAPHRPGKLLLERRWDVAALGPLSRHYYERCFVTRQPGADSPIFSSGFRTGAGGWVVAGSGTVTLPEGAPPQLVRVRAGGAPLAVTAAGSGTIALVPGAEAFVAAAPGARGALRIEVPGGVTAHIPALELFPVGRSEAAWLATSAGDRELLVPSAAHVHGRMQSDWITDLLLHDPDPDSPLVISLRWSQRLDLGGAVVSSTQVVPPGATVLARDVVASLLHAQGAGALRLTAARPFTALWRTYDVHAPCTLADPAFALPVTGAQAAAKGVLNLSFRPGATGVRSNVAFFNRSDRPVEVRLELIKPGAEPAPAIQVLRLPAWGFAFLDSDHLVGTSSRAIAADLPLRFTATHPVVAIVSLVENASNRSRYLPPGR